MHWRSLWQAPYRPLFFLAGLWALIVPMVWLLPEEIAPERVAWHSRELLFGMGGAAAGGYLLTALQAWTKKGPIRPVLTVIATCLWCAARLTAALSGHLPLVAAAIGASAYFAFLTAILAHGVVSSRAWHRFWAPLASAALGLSAFLFLGSPTPKDTTPLLYIVLIVLIAGRAVPAFTRHWLTRTGQRSSFCDRSTLSYLAIAGILAATWLGAARQDMLSGLLLIFAGALLLWQMNGWQSLSTRRYPALFILHVAFAWTPAALVLGGLAGISGQVPPAARLHALQWVRWVR